METHEELVALLGGTLTNPFFVSTRNREEQLAIAQAGLWAWSRHLSTKYPLWSLQPRAYASLNESDLPTVHPLRAFAQSIARDEGLLSVSPRGDAGGFDWLPALIDHRRC